MSFLIIMVLLLVACTSFMIRPQRQRQQQQQQMIGGANVGDDVLTTGGIYGTIAQAEDDDLVVEIADGVTVHMTRRGIAAVLPPEGRGRPGRRQRPALTWSRTTKRWTTDEGGVTDGEAPVRSEAGDTATADGPR